MKRLDPGSLILLLSFNLYCLQAIGQNFTPARTFSEPNLVHDFFCSEVTYPTGALEQGTEGTVILSFIVNEKGIVEDLQVKQPVSPAIDAEAIRLFGMLLWEPAIKLGNPVSTINEYSIKFDIKKYQKHCKLRGYDRTVYPHLPVDSSNKVYEVSQIDKPPSPIFPEKGMNLTGFINKNIKYPETAYKQSISGKVSLRFVIEPQGRVSNIKVIESVSGGCTQEAIRLLQLIKWMPGLKDDYAVRTFMNMDLNFKIPEESDLKMFESVQMNSN